MISHLTGTVIGSTPTAIILDVSGVGYRLFVTEKTLDRAVALASGTITSFHTHMVVRENSMDLYGFPDETELRFFELLLSVSGIGPKSALSVLNIADVATLQSAILQNDSSYLTKVSGIGAKSAQKIVLELQGKIEFISTADIASVHTEDMDTLEALIALGYTQSEIRAAIKEIPDDVEGTNARIKQALKLLAK